MREAEAIIAALEKAPAILIALVREIPVELRKRRPAPGKWSAHEQMCHVAAVDTIFLKRLELIVSEPEPSIVAYNPSADEADAYLAMDLEDAMQRFARDREDLAARLKRLPDLEWTKPVQHPEYAKYSAFIMARHLMLHDGLHGYRIEEILLKRDWA
jgi:uncharacterized damage-inducible protein DinB